MKVLVYSSKEIYDTAPFEGRAEADLIVYRENDRYVFVKDRFDINFGLSQCSDFQLKGMIERKERELFSNELRKVQ